MTNIEWTQRPGTKGETWNPVVGCRHVAEGCRNCYAETMSKRLAAMGQTDYAGILGKAITRPETLDKPLRWRKPRTVFVNSMSDLFHEDVPFEFIDEVMAVAAVTRRHTYQCLTKRPERMLEYWTTKGRPEAIANRIAGRFAERDWHKPVNGVTPAAAYESIIGGWGLPLPNWWNGTSIANQKDADRNIPILLQVPSAIRFISAEPLLGPVDLSRQIRPIGTSGKPLWPCAESMLFMLDWVIVGGESGPGARPCDIAWIRSIIQQCKAAGVPVFVKQLGAWPQDSFGADWPIGVVRCTYIGDRKKFNLPDKKGGDPTEWPEDLRVREYPEASA